MIALERFVLLLLVIIIQNSIAFPLNPSNNYGTLCRYVQKGRNSGLSITASASDEIDRVRLQSKESTQEQTDRLSMIRRLNEEADKFAGVSEQGEEDDMREIPVAETEWSGQSSVEVSRISSNNLNDVINRPLLATGDALVLLFFAAIGRSNHKEGLDLLSTFYTALPFLLPWLAVTPFLGSYSRESTSSVTNAILRILPGWAITEGCALAVRYYEKGYPPPTAFIVVSSIATLTLLSMWRVIYIKAFGSTSDEDEKSAGLFEVFKMVTTLVRRW